MELTDGVAAASVEFFSALERDNTREFWRSNRSFYEEAVRAPFLALLEGLPEAYGSWRTYRPQRDTRFARDKSPYKTFVGAVAHAEGGTGFFLRLDARGLLLASGYPMMARDQLVRFRDAVSDDGSGSEFAGLVARSAEDGVRVRPGRHEPLKGSPRGYPRDHERIEWLRWKGVEVSERVGAPAWLDTAEAPERIVEVWERAAPVNAWLDRHVGPSALSPEEIWGR